MTITRHDSKMLKELKKEVFSKMSKFFIKN